MNRGVKERKNVSVQANKDKATDERNPKEDQELKWEGDRNFLKAKKLVHQNPL